MSDDLVSKGANHEEMKSENDNSTSLSDVSNRIDQPAVKVNSIGSSERNHGGSSSMDSFVDAAEEMENESQPLENLYDDESIVPVEENPQIRDLNKLGMESVSTDNFENVLKDGDSTGVVLTTAETSPDSTNVQLISLEDNNIGNRPYDRKDEKPGSGSTSMGILHPSTMIEKNDDTNSQVKSFSQSSTFQARPENFSNDSGLEEYEDALVGNLSTVSQFTTSSQVTTHHQNTVKNSISKNGLPLKSIAMSSVYESSLSIVQNDAWAVKQGCADPPVVESFEVESGLSNSPMNSLQRKAVEPSCSESSNSSSISAPTETFKSIAPMKTGNNIFVDIGRLTLVGVLSLIGGVLISFFVVSTCHFVTIEYKEVGYYGQNFTGYAGMTEFSSIDSVFLGNSFCIPYNHEYYSIQEPMFARTSGLLATISASLASLTLWYYIFTKQTTSRSWKTAILFAASAAIFQLGTYQFFFSPICEEGSRCVIGSGSAVSIVAAGVYVYMAFEMHRNSPVREIRNINKTNLLHDTNYVGPGLV